ncbi:MAG: hypothetical protein KCHDKBKB_01835 [Elusimicrobia bacterium]|nr:hypothetical protein [Elusimicrobiota bacterium]
MGRPFLCELDKLVKKKHYLLLGLILLPSMYLLISTAKNTSLVYDEVIYAPAGLIYLKTGQLTPNIEHPPLQKIISGVPMLLQGAKWPIERFMNLNDAWRNGYQIFFHNTVPAPKLIFLCRFSSILITLVLGIVIYFFCKKLFGLQAALLSCSVFLFDPLILGNGSLAMNDIYVTFFMTGSIFLFYEWLMKRNRTTALLSGISAGAAISSKFTGFLLAPIFILMYLLQRKIENKRIEKSDAVGAAIIILATLFVVLSLYNFNLEMLNQALSQGRSFHKERLSDGYLLGEAVAKGWFYYPTVSLIKTPLPLLFFWITVGIALVKRKDNSRGFLLFIPILVLWFSVLISNNHFGIRYLLPAIPFLAILIGVYYSSLKSRKDRIVCWMLMGWMVIESFITHPHHMAYFNPLVGGIKNGWKWLDGSNQDWGQDLPTLAKVIHKQAIKPSILMGYWGSNRPEAWGIDYQDVLSPAITNSFRKETINPSDVPVEWLVVSAELRHNPSTKAAYAWLNNKNPFLLIGGTLFVYDISRDEESILRIGDIYKEMGRKALYQRQLERANFLLENQA